MKKGKARSTGFVFISLLLNDPIIFRQDVYVMLLSAPSAVSSTDFIGLLNEPWQHSRCDRESEGDWVIINTLPWRDVHTPGLLRLLHTRGGREPKIGGS